MAKGSLNQEMPLSEVFLIHTLMAIRMIAMPTHTAITATPLRSRYLLPAHILRNYLLLRLRTTRTTMNIAIAIVIVIAIGLDPGRFLLSVQIRSVIHGTKH